MAKRARVKLAVGEELVLLGHEIAIVVPGEDDGDRWVYTAEEWNDEGRRSHAFDKDGDLRKVTLGGKPYGPPVDHRFARCRSERAWFERLFARTFKDPGRIVV